MKKRVDIELDEDILKWAGIEAAKLGISRRKFIQNVVTRIGFLQCNLRGRLEFVHVYPGGNSTIPIKFDNPYQWYELDKAQQQPKCSSNE